MNKSAANTTPYYPDDMVVRSWGTFLGARLTQLAAAVVATYVWLAILLPAGWLAEIMRCIQATFSFLVLLGYWRRATVCFYIVGRWPEAHNVIALGIWISWFSIFCSALWAILYRLSGQPSWMINNDYYTAWVMASSFAASLHVFAPNMMGQDLPRVDKVRFSAAAALGLCLLLIVGLWRPDLSSIADYLHDHMAEPQWMIDGLLFIGRQPVNFAHTLLR